MGGGVFEAFGAIKVRLSVLWCYGQVRGRLYIGNEVVSGKVLKQLFRTAKSPGGHQILLLSSSTPTRVTQARQISPQPPPQPFLSPDMFGKSIYGCKFFWMFTAVGSIAVYNFPDQSPFLVSKYNDIMGLLMLMCENSINRLPDWIQAYADPERLAFTVVSVLTLELTFWTLNGVLFVMYKYDLFRKYAVHDGLPDEEMIFEAFLDAVIGHFFIRPPLLYLAFPLFQSDGWMSGEALPSLPIFLAQVFFCLCVDDTVFYWSHRGLHHPAIYKYIHKKHHVFKVREEAVAQRCLEQPLVPGECRTPWVSVEQPHAQGEGGDAWLKYVSQKPCVQGEGGRRGSDMP